MSLGDKSLELVDSFLEFDATQIHGAISMNVISNSLRQPLVSPRVMSFGQSSYVREDISAGINLRLMLGSGDVILTLRSSRVIGRRLRIPLLRDPGGPVKKQVDNVCSLFKRWNLLKSSLVISWLGHVVEIPSVSLSSTREALKGERACAVCAGERLDFIVVLIRGSAKG